MSARRGKFQVGKHRRRRSRVTVNLCDEIPGDIQKGSRYLD